ncbi:MAG: GNAT family N-acetyltransferase [Oscillochloridaceae bacterium umkhey_bin13]
MAPIRAVAPADAAEWLRLRLALWPDDAAEEHRAAIEPLLSGTVPPPDPTLQAALVWVRPTGGLGGLIELGLRQYAEGCDDGPIAYLEGWYVDPDLRGTGVGRALVAAAEHWARRQGCRQLASDAELDNLASQAAHLRLGFQEVGRSVHFCKRL